MLIISIAPDIGACQVERWAHIYTKPMRLNLNPLTEAAQLSVCMYVKL